MGISVSKIEGLQEVKDILKEYREGGALELKQYREIGTIDECSKAREKQIPKKMILSPDCDKCDKDGTLDCTKECASYSTPRPVLVCPNCKRIGGIEENQYKFCPECGQSIDLRE